MSRFPSETRIDAKGPFDHRAALGTLAAHAVDGLHRLDVDSGALTRWVDIDGEAHPITVGLDSRGVTLRAATRDLGVNDRIISRVRHWFDLDTDPAPINTHLAADPMFATQVAKRPGVRITRFHAVFEAVILTVLGQQVTLATGRLFGARLIAAHGTRLRGHGAAAGLRGFPAPHVLAAQPTAELRATIGLTGARARTVRETAELFASEGASDMPPGPSDAAKHPRDRSVDAGLSRDPRRHRS